MSETGAVEGGVAAGSEVAPVDEIRRQIPALERRHRGLPVAYFDGPGGTQVPRAVGEALLEYLYHHNANTHWSYPSSAETDRALERARAAFAGFFGGAPEEVVFGPNMTSLTHHLARALAPRLEPGDEIVVTDLDHHANIDPWRRLEAERGVRLRSVEFRLDRGRLDWDDFERKMSERTRLVAVGHASNALGTVTDARRAVGLAGAAGALSFVDGVHFAHHDLIDVEALGCDFYACSPYKFYGPHLGTLWGRRELLDELDFARLQPAGQRAPERAESGTLSHEAIVGAGAAVEWLAGLTDRGSLRQRLEIVFAELHRRGRDLTRRLWEGLGEIAGVTLYGPSPETPRTATLSFTVDGVPSSRVVEGLAERAIFATHGDFYATTVVARLGLGDEGLVRTGCAAYTTVEEIDRLVAGVAELAAQG
jgi:cysteine desulfurase family protein (TIGR01976 family)